MFDIILDTNIVIYLSNKEEKYLRFLDQNKDMNFAVSVITFMEILVWAKNDFEHNYLLKLMNNFEILTMTKEIALISCEFLKQRTKKSLKDPKLPDIIIASTALFYNKTLVTNNPKDFKSFKELKLIIP